MSRVTLSIQSDGRPLLGVVVHTYNPVFVEIAGMLGFQIVWIETEHLPISRSQVGDLCRIAAGVGLLTMIRIPDARRESVLKAAECGPDIIDLPMGNSREVVEELVRNARYAPEGDRGFFAASRAMRYGLVNSISEQQRILNNEICLMSQIETQDAVDIVEDLCAVPGLDAILIGPGDLSVSFGVNGDYGHPRVLDAINHSIEVAKYAGKIVALPCAPDSVGSWAEKGVDIAFVSSETACMKDGCQAALNKARDGMHRSLDAVARKG